MNLTHQHSKLCQIPGPISAYLEQFGHKLFIGFLSVALAISFHFL